MTAWWDRFEEVTTLIRIRTALDFYPDRDKGGHL
jgi:hypothetical protein